MTKFILSVFLIFLIVIRSLSVRYTLIDQYFYGFLLLLNLYIIFYSKNLLISKSGIYLYFTCLLSIIISFLLSFYNPIYNSFARLILFILSFNIVGPFFINSFSIYFRTVLFKVLVFILPILSLLDLIFIIIFKNITNAGLFYGILQSPNLSSTIAAINIVLILNAFYKKSFSFILILKLAIILISILVILATASRAAIFSLLITIFVMSLIHIKKAFLFIFFLLILLYIARNDIEMYSEILISKIETRQNSGDQLGGRSKIIDGLLLDFKDNPLSGVGFYNTNNPNLMKINEDNSMEYSIGWLFVLSSTGILGFLYFIYILYKIFLSFNKKFLNQFHWILIFLIMHSFFEGYIFSGGGLLFFIFWLTISNLKYENITNFA